MNRKELIRRLIDDIDETEFQARYRRKDNGSPVRGWKARLENYFWRKPAENYDFNMKKLRSIIEEGKELALSQSCSDSRYDIARVAFAEKVFDWGGVPQKNLEADQVRRVIQAALDGFMREKTPMNSGWTKVAAFVTAHLEDDNRSQAIWDSRVSWSLVRRLDTLLSESNYTQLPCWLNNIGIVPGRGGTRTKDDLLKSKIALKIRWPNAYGKWASHFAASQLIREIRDELNHKNIPTLTSENGRAVWTVRTVEMVLFMDGY